MVCLQLTNVNLLREPVVARSRLQCAENFVVNTHAHKWFFSRKLT